MPAWQRLDISVLQYLSEYFVSGSEELSLAAYKQIARRFGLWPEIVVESLERLQALGLVALTEEALSVSARLDQESWATRSTRAAYWYAAYVSNAPAALRGPDAQRPVAPTRGCPAGAQYSPPPARCSSVVASNFNGVTDPDVSYNRFCCEPFSPPLELCPVRLDCASLDLTATVNVEAIDVSRLMLRAWWQTTVQALTVAEIMDVGFGTGGSSSRTAYNYVFLVPDNSVTSTTLASAALYVGTSAANYEKYESSEALEVLSLAGCGQTARVISLAVTSTTCAPAFGLGGTATAAGVSRAYVYRGRAKNNVFLFQLEGALEA
jgi:hypothetical protein